MTYRRARSGAVPRHSARPGAWAQLPGRFLGMLFIAALLLASQQQQTYVPAPVPSPASDVGPGHGGSR